MKSKLCILYCRTAILESSLRIYTPPSGQLVSPGWIHYAIITFSEKPAFPRGVALRITRLYAKMFQRLLRKAAQSVTFRSSRPALREAKVVTSATQGGTPYNLSTKKPCTLAGLRIYKRYLKYPLKTELVIWNRSSAFCIAELLL